MKDYHSLCLLWTKQYERWWMSFVSMAVWCTVLFPIYTCTQNPIMGWDCWSYFPSCFVFGQVNASSRLCNKATIMASVVTHDFLAFPLMYHAFCFSYLTVVHLHYFASSYQTFLVQFASSSYHTFLVQCASSSYHCNHSLFDHCFIIIIIIILSSL